jgi:hypothetical protein
MHRFLDAETGNVSWCMTTLSFQSRAARGASTGKRGQVHFPVSDLGLPRGLTSK